jgi:probable phosphoglycerate mutase
MQSKLKSRNTRVILLRHGQSTYNALGLYQGSSDRPNLTELGRHQAQLTGEFLKGITFDAIYASPLKRAQETAKAIVRSRTQDPHPTIHILPHLQETELPAWQGLPFQFVKEQFPEEYRCWKQRPHEFRMEIPQETGRGGDGGTRRQLIQNRQYCFPALDLYDRIQKFWQEILPHHIGQTILIVSHGGTNRALISTALGVSPAHYHCIEQSNCALSILNFPDDCLESGQLEAMNRATHVGEKLPKIEDGLRLLLIPAETENPEQIQQLVQLLKDEAIDFSISGDLDNSHFISDRVLQHHPTTVQLQVLREDFSQLWQQAINATNRIDSSQSLTGLVVARDRLIQSFLGQVLGMNRDRLWRLHLHPGTISILHYPNSEHPPILQAMNLGI